MPDSFVHSHASHCESGVMSSLLRHHGLPMSEAMAFGLASALSFAYLPFIRINGLPLVSYRMPPRAIIKGLERSLGLGMRFETFRSPPAGMERLDALLDAGKLVGLQTSVFWLPYFPPDLRFHFNAHNLLVYGRELDDYLISDPVAEAPVRCAREDLRRARFAKGMLAPKGLLYFLTRPPAPPDWVRLGRRALARTARIMLAPLPLVGVHGMRMLARQIERLPLADGGEGRACTSATSFACRRRSGPAAAVSGSSMRRSCRSWRPRPATRRSTGSRRAWSRSATAGASSRSPRRA